MRTLHLAFPKKGPASPGDAPSMTAANLPRIVGSVLEMNLSIHLTWGKIPAGNDVPERKSLTWIPEQVAALREPDGSDR